MASKPKSKYKMTMSLNVLNHLGFNLYSNVPAVLSEVVANSYDADATNVDIQIDSQKIIIADNGNGMTVDEINERFLNVGYQRRENGGAKSEVLKRAVMGRKGIGKLSLFSIANKIRVFTTKKVKGTIEKNGFELNRYEIENQIKASETYNPEELKSFPGDLKKGTRLEITDFKKGFGGQNFVIRRLARRFSVIGSEHKFGITVNGHAIDVADRDFFKKIQLIWFIGAVDKKVTNAFSFANVSTLNGKIDGTKYEISGWIGTVAVPSDLDEEDTGDSKNSTNNKISVLVRGKMAQEDILKSFNEGGIYASYLIGEIHADFLDDDSLEDISTSSRQTIKEDDERYQTLIEHVYSFMKQIQREWDLMRKKIAKEKAVDNAEAVNPALKKWFTSLKQPAERERAVELFATIENLHFGKGEDKEKKKELYKYGILAFEKLKLKSNLDNIKVITSASDLRLAAIFSDIRDIEANMYYDIASERVAVIKKFQQQLDKNVKENLLRDYLFDNLWLLNPSWERAAKASAVMEQRVTKAFNVVTNTLSKEEKKGRIDIKYRTYAGKHIIIELKRYKAGYKISSTTLVDQVRKYRDALRKCLATTDPAPHIESIIVLGETIKNEDPTEGAKMLAVVNARVIYYDTLIEESLEAYNDWLSTNEEVGKIKTLIDKL